MAGPDAQRGSGGAEEGDAKKQGRHRCRGPLQTRSDESCHGRRFGLRRCSVKRWKSLLPGAPRRVQTQGSGGREAVTAKPSFDKSPTSRILATVTAGESSLSRTGSDELLRRTLPSFRTDPLGLCAGGVDRMQRAAAESGAGTEGSGPRRLQPDPGDGRCPGSGCPVPAGCRPGSRRQQGLQADGSAVELVGVGSPRGPSRGFERTGNNPGPRAAGALELLNAASFQRRRFAHRGGTIAAC